VTVWPASTTAETILASGADGIMLSNGPGDPKENVFCIEQLKKLIGQKPVFGICLGHQLAALALGGDTIKLKYGHRGGNQPVRNPEAGRTYITSQNHGYAVVADSLKGVGVESFVNANDGSCEGMDYPSMNCFTVQFHPEAASGPRDTAILFDRFVERMVK
jgi:carbamoyl-phosphate synthase small subunit